MKLSLLATVTATVALFLSSCGTGSSSSSSMPGMSAQEHAAMKKNN